MFYLMLGREEMLLVHIRWNAIRAHMVNSDGWVRDGDKLFLWVPWQYRLDIKDGTRLVIDSQGQDTVRPEVDYRKVFKYSRLRWKDIYTGTAD